MRGAPPTDRKARRGLSTPPTKLRWARSKSPSDLGAGGPPARSELISDPQGVEHLFRRREDAGEDRCLPLRVSARLARPNVHEEVEAFVRIVGLEREYN